MCKIIVNISSSDKKSRLELEKYLRHQKLPFWYLFKGSNDLLVLDSILENSADSADIEAEILSQKNETHSGYPFNYIANGLDQDDNASINKSDDGDSELWLSLKAAQAENERLRQLISIYHEISFSDI